MPWLQLTLPVSQADHPRYESALEDAGALSVTLADADAETPDEQAIFEPGVGETPLWQQMTLTALFEGDTDAEWLLSELNTLDGALDWSKAQLEIVEDQEFNMVRGYYATGKNIRLKAQVKPGLIAGSGKGGAKR